MNFQANNFILGAANSIYLSLTHTDNVIENYLNKLDAIFRRLVSFENGEDIKENLRGPVCPMTFKRLP